ncbi:MAG: hypothetical protein SOZ56_01050 [Oscillospiraceae bacterium]|nr:hypothetical protein [Oscillospiraceae bacterium]
MAATYTRLDSNGLLFLLQQLKTKISAAKTAVTSGSANGTVSVDGSDVAVKGLKSAAYKDVSASVASGNGDPVASGAVYSFVTSAIAGIEHFSAQIVSELPSAGKSNVLYLVAKASAAGGNGYDEYLYISNAWELIGSTDIDLSGYVQASEMHAITNTEITDIVDQVWS